MVDNHANSHIFTNKGVNTLMREFEGVLTNNPSIINKTECAPHYLMLLFGL